MKLKIALAILLVLAIAGGLGGYYFLASIDGLVEAAIEKYGSEVMGTAVRVSSVRIELREGRGRIRGLTIANPPGFKAAKAFSMGEIVLDIDPMSVASSPVIIEGITIGSPEIYFEVAASTKSNFDTLLDNVKRYQASSGGSSSGSSRGSGGSGGSGEPTGSSTSSGGAAEADELQIAVRRFTFEDAAISADVEAVAGEGSNVQLDLPALTLKDPGGSAGAPASEVGAVVMSAYSKKVLKAVAREALKGKAGKWLEEQGEGGKAVKGLLDQILK